MITQRAFKKLAEQNRWLVGALENLKHPDDDRPFERRVKESIAFIAFRPFEKLSPNWLAKGEFYPIFHKSRMAGSDGAMCSSYPLIVFHKEGWEGFKYVQLSPLNTGLTIGKCMEWYVDTAKKNGYPKCIAFDAVIIPLQVRINPHRMIAECYEIYRFPEPLDFKFDDFKKWLVTAPQE